MRVFQLVVCFMTFVLFNSPLYGQDGETYLKGAIPTPSNNEGLVLESVNVLLVPGSTECAVTLLLTVVSSRISNSSEHFVLQFYDQSTYPYRDPTHLKDLVIVLNGQAVEYDYSFDDSSRRHVASFSSSLRPGMNYLHCTESIRMGSGEAYGAFTFDLANAWNWGSESRPSVSLSVLGQHSLIRFGSRSFSDFSTLGRGKWSVGNSSFPKYYSLDRGGITAQIADKPKYTELDIVYTEPLYYGFGGVEPRVSHLLSYMPGDFGLVIRYWASAIDQAMSTYGNRDSNIFWKEVEAEYEAYARSLSSSDLRLLRNTLYAIHGWKFRDPTLNQYFQSVNWYFPNLNREQSEPEFSVAERKILSAIEVMEKR